MHKRREGDYFEDKNKCVPRSEPEPEADVRCGYGNCKPPFLQRMNNPKILLLVLSLFSITHGFIVNGINNVNTQSIERRFGLSSANVALISSAHDFAAGVFSIAMAFVGSGTYKGRWLAAGSLCAAVGSAVMVVPHFTTDLYDWGQKTFVPMCIPNSNIPEECDDSQLNKYLGVFICGMSLMGIGSVIQYTVGVGFIDDSVPANSSPLYLSTLYGVSILGPGLGYLLGAQFLAIYVDFDKVDTDTVDLKLKDPRWVGAWWTPFFISMSLFFLSSLLLACFGAELPAAKEIRRTRTSQTHGANSKTAHVTNNGKRQPIKNFPRILLALLRNAPFILVLCSSVPNGILIVGLATFLPKFLQNRFNLPAYSAAIMAGAMAVPGGAGGTFFGGFICNRLKLKVRGMIKLSIISYVITIGATAVLLIGCEKAPIAGITSPYQDGGVADNNVLHPCNSACKCTTRYYHPVCTEDGYQYFTACHAGCVVPGADFESYHNCTCPALTQETQATSVANGECDTDCKNIYLFGVLFFISTFFSFVPMAPGDAITLRCIEEEHRTFSMGVKQLVVRFLGTVPGPIIFGVLTDRSCVVWQTICGDDTSCWIYDIDEVSRSYFITAATLKLIAIILITLALCVYKPPPDDVETQIKPEIKIGGSSERQSNTEKDTGSLDGFVNGGFDTTHL